MEKKKIGFSGSTFKMLALVTMLIDHVGAVIVQRMLGMPELAAKQELYAYVYMPLRYIGRLAFPLYCFFLVEGFLHTSDVRRYAGRIFLFALISEIPFNLAITGDWINIEYQNVFWELGFAVLALSCLREVERRGGTYAVQVLARLLILLVFGFGAQFLNFDYGMNGIISIAVLYVFRQNKAVQLLAGAVSFFWEPVAPLSFLALAFYNGKRGRKIKYFFYVFYPAHLVLLYLAARLLGCQW